MIWPYSGLFGLYDFENGKRWRHMNFYFQLILKSPKKYENLDFSISGLCLAFKKYFGLFSILLTFRCLEHSKSFKFESFWSYFAIKKIFAENFANRISVIKHHFTSRGKNSQECFCGGPKKLQSLQNLELFSPIQRKKSTNFMSLGKN